MAETLSPTARRARTALAMLGVEHWNGNEAPIQDLASFARDIVERVPTNGVHIGEGTKFLRVRVIANATKLFLRDVVARLPGDSKSFQRCNIPGQSMLYCGVNLDTCFTETDPKVGQSICVSEFSVVEGQSIKIAQIGGLDFYRRNERAMLEVKDLENSTKAALDKHLNHDNLDTVLIDAFMAHMFSRRIENESQYRLTALISNLIMQKTGSDGVMYPSVEHRGGLCYAIKSEISFSKLRLISAEERCVAEKLPYSIWVAPVTRRSSSWDTDGRLIWDR